MTESVGPLPFPLLRFFDPLGEPLAGGKLYSYLSGTSTPLALYADAAGTVPLSNPVILDGTGQRLIYAQVAQPYRLDLYDTNNVHQPDFPVDNIRVTTSSVGSFVPTLAGATTAGVGTYTGQIGLYVRMGPLVLFHIFLACASHTGTGFARVTTLPFTSPMRAVVPVLLHGAGGAAFSGPVVAWLSDTPPPVIELYFHNLTTRGLLFIDLQTLCGTNPIQLAMTGIYHTTQ